MSPTGSILRHEIEMSEVSLSFFICFPYSCFHSKIDARINNDNIVEGENIGS